MKLKSKKIAHSNKVLLDNIWYSNMKILSPCHADSSINEMAKMALRVKKKMLNLTRQEGKTYFFAKTEKKSLPSNGWIDEPCHNSP